MDKSGRYPAEWTFEWWWARNAGSTDDPRELAREAFKAGRIAGGSQLDFLLVQNRRMRAALVAAGLSVPMVMDDTPLPPPPEDKGR